MEFLKSMAESMEVLRKQNEDLNTRLTRLRPEAAKRKKTLLKGVRRKAR
jgi:hypothetical protein